MRKVVNIKRAIAGISAAVLAGFTLVPVLSPQKASAYNLITARQIKLSSSATGAATTSYYVEFQAATAATVKSIAIDFCQNSPILGDTCTSTPGTNTPTLTGVTVNANGGVGVGNLGAVWSASVLASNHTVAISNATGIAMTVGTTYYFTLGNITNHTTNGTFYSRILTFPNDTTSNYAGGYTGLTANLGTNVPTDAGGVALSLANQVTIQAKVQERLTFCIYTGAGPCPGSISNPVTLGDANGVLDPNASYTTATSASGNPKFGLSSNAGSGVAVRMKGGTLKRTTCSDGQNQPCSINPMATAAAAAAGSEQFGLRLANVGGNITATAPYTSATNYYFDDSNTTGTQSTYGAQVASMIASGEQSAELQFVGNIAPTTESGIYTTTLIFIATGTY